MPNESDKKLAGAAVNRGVLSPAQANFALRAIQAAEAAGATPSLREILLKNRIVSPQRWDEFELSLTAKTAAVAAPPELPEPVAPSRSKTLSLPHEVGGYRLTSKIGQGGMGTVYKATQLAMRRTVAIKILDQALADDPGFVENFRFEARAAAALNHPNVIVPIDVGEFGGLHFLAMEYIEGESLATWMEQKGRLPWKEAVEIVLQVAQGLAHAHKLAMVHRDIKPDNILIDRPSGLAKIADLGLARRKGDVTAEDLDGQAVGTPYYIAPEQARAEKTIDGRADIYSLGATLWHLIAGVPPFEGPSSAVIMTKHLTEFVPDPRTAVADCPEDLVAIIFMMMAKDRFDRYPDCAALISDLEHLLKGRPIKAPKPPKRGVRERGGLPLPMGPLRAGAAGSRMREGQASRHAGPAASRLHGPLATRVGTRGREGTGVHSPRRRTQAPPLPWAIMVVVALVTTAGLAMLRVPSKENPSVPADNTAKSSTPVNPKDPAATPVKANLPVKTATSSGPTAPTPATTATPAVEDRESLAKGELREAERFAKSTVLPFDQTPVITKYERIIRMYPNTQAAREAQTQIDAIRQALKSMPPSHAAE